MGPVRPESVEVKLDNAFETVTVPVAVLQPLLSQACRVTVYTPCVV